MQFIIFFIFIELRTNKHFRAKFSTYIGILILLTQKYTNIISIKSTFLVYVFYKKNFL